jgi:hypothetical protein
MSRTLRSTPIGLGGVGLSSKGSVPGVPGLKASSINAGKSAKGRKATVTNALPFLELSIAIGDGLSNFKSSIDEELVLQATLQVTWAPVYGRACWTKAPSARGLVCLMGCGHAGGQGSGACVQPHNSVSRVFGSHTTFTSGASWVFCSPLCLPV